MVTFTLRAARAGRHRELKNIASHAQAEIIAADWWGVGWREITINGEPWTPADR